jgi:hypothetical protein
MGLVGDLDVYVKRPDALPLDALDRDLDTADSERDGHAPQALELGTSVEQGGEKHVARQSADAVEIRDPAHSRPRAIRAAIVPAPRPSSIPTTASPAAQDAALRSAPSSAVRGAVPDAVGTDQAPVRALRPGLRGHRPSRDDDHAVRLFDVGKSVRQPVHTATPTSWCTTTVV